MKLYLVYAYILIVGLACSKSSPTTPSSEDISATDFRVLLPASGGKEGAIISISGLNLTTVTVVKFSLPLQPVLNLVV